MWPSDPLLKGRNTTPIKDGNCPKSDAQNQFEYNESLRADVLTLMSN